MTVVADHKAERQLFDDLLLDALDRARRAAEEVASGHPDISFQISVSYGPALDAGNVRNIPALNVRLRQRSDGRVKGFFLDSSLIPSCMVAEIADRVAGFLAEVQLEGRADSKMAAGR